MCDSENTRRQQRPEVYHSSRLVMGIGVKNNVDKSCPRSKREQIVRARSDGVKKTMDATYMNFSSEIRF